MVSVGLYSYLVGCLPGAARFWVAVAQGNNTAASVGLYVVGVLRSETGSGDVFHGLLGPDRSFIA